MEKVPVTAAGFARMEVELKQLKTVERPAVIKAIAEAREHGDLSENAEYNAAREKQSFIEGRIKQLEFNISSAEIIDIAAMAGEKVVKFGATVKLLDEDSEEEITYKIVGDYEADLPKGLLSISAPISRALIGKKKGDSVEVFTPKGQRDYEILDVSFVA